MLVIWHSTIVTLSLLAIINSATPSLLWRVWSTAQHVLGTRKSQRAIESTYPWRGRGWRCPDDGRQLQLINCRSSKTKPVAHPTKGTGAVPSRMLCEASSTSPEQRKISIVQLQAEIPPISARQGGREGKAWVRLARIDCASRRAGLCAVDESVNV